MLVVGIVKKKKDQAAADGDEGSDEFEEGYDDGFGYDPGLYPVTDYETDENGDLSGVSTADPNALWDETY